MTTRKSLSVLLAPVLVIAVAMGGASACGSTETADVTEPAQATSTQPEQSTTSSPPATSTATPTPSDAVNTSSTVAASSTVPERDYPGKELWFDESHGLPTAYSIVGINGSEGFDMAQFVNTEMAEKLIKLQYDTLVRFKEDMDPELVALWEKRGIKKELHDAQDPKQKWASYTPIAALEPGNTKQYPVVFSFHGNNNTILHAEGFGFPHLGAELGFITVIPDCNNSEGAVAAAKIPEILDFLESHGYPIDRSRVYLTGMSKGGVCAAQAALALPDVVTAIAIHGAAFALNTKPTGAVGDKPSAEAVGIPPEAYQDALAYDIPLYLAVGEYDFNQLPLRTEPLIDGLNLWLEMNDCPTRLVLEDCKAAAQDSGDPAVKFLGVTADKTRTEVIDGSVHYFAQYYNTAGVKMVELIGIANHPHWTTASYPQMAWEFMSRFSKDDHGKLIVSK